MIDAPYASTLGFDPLAGRHIENPGPSFARLIEKCPIVHVDKAPPGYLAITRAKDQTRILRDYEQWINGAGQGFYSAEEGSHVLGDADSPDHGRQRATLLRFFTPSWLRSFTPAIEEIARELFDAFSQLGEGDFVTAIAQPLPAIVIAELLGVPHGDRVWFQEVSERIVSGLGGDPDAIPVMVAARNEMAAYLDNMVDKAAEVLDRARAGGIDADLPDTVMMGLAKAWRVTGKLDRWEVIQLASTLLIGGHETTTSLLGAMMARLLRDAELANRLRADPALHPIFIEEMVRLEAPVQGLCRTATRDVDFHGVHLPAGTKVQLLYAAANVDPDLFDDPQALLLERDLTALRREHLGFGHGKHICIGAPLARIEAGIALHQMLSRFPDAQWNGNPIIGGSVILRGYRSVPMRWKAP